MAALAGIIGVAFWSMFEGDSSQIPTPSRAAAASDTCPDQDSDEYYAPPAVLDTNAPYDRALRQTLAALLTALESGRSHAGAQMEKRIVS
jgi:hypothetical protein